MDDEEILKRMLTKFNNILGTDLDNLSKCHDIHEELLKEKTAIENSLSLANSEAPSKMKRVVENAEKASKALNEKREEAVGVLESIKKKLEDNAEISETLSKKTEKIRVLKCAVEYINIVEDIENISRELETSLRNKEDSCCVQLFISLRGSGNDQGIGGRLHDCNAPHLQKFAQDTIRYWHELLRERYTQEFDQSLKAMKWPLVGSNVSAVSTAPSAECLNRFQMLVEYLLQIQIDNDGDGKCPEQNLVVGYVPVCLPVALLVRPLRKRFLYHFYGSKQTNRPDKPEWYLTQLLTWLRDHQEFLDQYVQPVVDRTTGHGGVDTRSEFTRALVYLAVEKLHSDLEQRRLVPGGGTSEDLFAHLVDECLGFAKELAKEFDYPPPAPRSAGGGGCPNVLAVLTQGQYFVKWLTMEKKYATEKVDAMLLSPDAWEPLDSRSSYGDALDEDAMRVTRLADDFLNLLAAVRERYAVLAQPGHRLQFLDLQLELIDDFRVRLLQLSHEQPDDESESRVPQIMNTVHYIAGVLNEWSANIHYLQLHHYKCQLNTALAENNCATSRFDTSNTTTPSSSEGSPKFIGGRTIDTGRSTTATRSLTSSDVMTSSAAGAFDSAVELLVRFCADHVTSLSETIVLGAKAKSWSYRKDRWFAMPVRTKEEMSLSPTACPMLQVLSARLHKSQSRLAAPLFDAAWRQVASALDQFLYEELALRNTFNAGGAAQFRYDTERCLWPLFAQYTGRREMAAVFPRLNECCTLLTLGKGSALLLLEALRDGATDAAETDAAGTLRDVGVVYFNARETKEILDKRMDLTLE